MVQRPGKDHSFILKAQRRATGIPRKLSPKINVRRCSKHAVLLQVLAGPLDGQQIPGKACPTWKPAQVLCINNELKYVGHCWANQDSWLVAHASTTESNCGGNSLSLYYIYVGILGFPQNRDKTRFHGQFVVPACSHKLLAITAITGSTSTNSTSTETNNRIWGSQRIWEATCDHVRPCA